MLEDLNGLPSDTVIETDICIVGAGIAGLTLAREFLGSTTKVMIVESGGLTGDDGANTLNDGETTALKYFATMYGRTRGLGGTSELWAGQCTPMDATDFEVRSWVTHSGWPISRSALDEFYARAYEVFALPRDVLDHQATDAFRVRSFASRVAGLVPHVSVFSPKRYLGRELRGSLSQSQNISVLLHATATEFVTGENPERVEALQVRSLDGYSALIRARKFVLAAGAIENARLLLVSTSGKTEGLGNRRGLVGRFLQDHVIGDCAVIESEQVARLWRHAELVRRGGLRWASKLRLADDEQARLGVLNATASVVFDYEDNEAVERMVRLYRAVARRSRSEASSQDVRYLLTNPFRVLAFGARHFGYSIPALSRPKTIRLSCITEQAPNPDSRVTLSSRLDALGVPRARVEWRLTESELGTLRALTKLCAIELFRIGLGVVRPAEWLSDGNGAWTANVRDILHCAGTTRMAADSVNGVVDPNSRVFDVDNLFVAGSSVFPTSGHANPALTIAAMSIRLADHLKNQHA